MPVILEHAPVMFQCNKCAWFGHSLPELIDHHDATHELLVSRQPMPAAPLANSTAPTVALDLTHRPARPLESRSKARPVGEIELAPSEAVGQVGRRVKG